MPSSSGHGYSASMNQTKAQLATAYNELGKELSSQKVRVVGNYTLGKVIGEGTYGKVRLGTHRLTGSRVAIKQIPKALSAQLTREIHHHRRLHHPHVTQLYEVIATESYIWLVTELCAGGELFDYLVEKGRLSEEETRAIFGQLCLAVAYIHEKGVVHRDLKLENVLLDERCRVKLGDFGFTREFERGSLLDTFCGTTGYASPEMLLGKKYHGQEVDIWSLGIIVYALLTGTLPFDDDDEDVMRDKIIKGDYDDPEWLTPDARDIIRRILVQDPSKRLSIAQILAHKWFTDPLPSLPPLNTRRSRPPSWDRTSSQQHPLASMQPTLEPMPEGSSSSAFSHTSSTFAANVSDMFDAHPDSTPTTPEESHGSHSHPHHVHVFADIQRSNSDATLTLAPHEFQYEGQQPSHASPFLPVTEEDNESNKSTQEEREDALARLTATAAPPPTRPTPPPIFPTRTPVRTKRRSVSSTLSQEEGVATPSSAPNTPAPAPKVDFAGLMTIRAPVLFSTPLDRELLNTLAALGLDTGQMVHSVLTDACDASSALWWMLRRRAEERRVEREREKVVEVERELELEKAKQRVKPQHTHTDSFGNPLPHPGHGQMLVTASLPELALVPATPITNSFGSPTSPGDTDTDTPRAVHSIDEARAGLVAYVAGARKTLDSPLPPLPLSIETASSLGVGTPTGTPVTKPRSSSVSMLQRVGLAVVRKKSDERVRDRERERVNSSPGGLGAGGDPNAAIVSTGTPSSSGFSERSGGRGSGEDPKTPNRKLTKSPPAGGIWSPSSTNESTTNLNLSPGWFGLSSPPTSQSGHGHGSTFSQESHDARTLRAGSGNTGPSGAAATGSGGRSRASILNAFKQWFQAQNDERKGKNKRSKPPPIPLPPPPVDSYAHLSHTPSPSTPYAHDRDRTVRASGRKRAKRASVGSHRSGRSSSVNSRRSSTSRVDLGGAGGGAGLGLGLGLARSRSDASSHRRVGTPEMHYGARPALHSKSPSNGSISSGRHHSGSASALAALRKGGAASPMGRYHARVGSSSSTRAVVRQAKPAIQSAHSVFKPSHTRSGSAASSSVSSSRRGSWMHERERGEWDESASPSQAVSDAEGPGLFETPRRPFAQRRSAGGGLFGTPGGGGGGAGHGSAGRNSWKKSWGREPPGWSSRSAQVVPVEVIATDYPLNVGGGGTNVRDVFSGNSKIVVDAGDDSDWVDEDDEDVDAFARGFGQVGGARTSKPLSSSPIPFTRGSIPQAQPPRGRSSGAKGRHSPVATSMPLPPQPAENVKSEGMPDARATRRGQIATSSFKNPIVEEDEEEEEE